MPSTAASSILRSAIRRRSVKKALSIALALAVAFSFAACQATPKEPIVIKKDTERMVEKAQEALPPEVEKLPLTERYTIKEHLQKEITKMDGKLVIRVDADVAVPNAQGVSITHVVPANFSQDTVTDLFHALCKDTVMYNGHMELTKKQLEYAILAAKQEKAEFMEGGHEEEWIARIEKSIQDLEAQYAAALESFADVVFDGTLYPEEIWISDVYCGTHLMAWALEFSGEDDVPDGPVTPRKQIRVSNNSDREDVVLVEGRKYYPNYSASLEYSDTRYYDGSWECYWDSKRARIASSANLTQSELTAVGLPVEEAVARAEALFTQVQIPFTVQDIIYVAAEAPFYELQCSRQVRSANLTIGGEGVGGDGISPYWAYERLTMWMNANGILYFAWHSPYEVRETEVESATLMPFEQIEEIFYGMMKNKYAPAAKQENGTRINVSKVSLQLQRLKLKEDNTEAILAPAWCFYGTRQVDEAIRNEGMMSDWERGYMPLLTVNAVDGSIIDLEIGY